MKNLWKNKSCKKEWFTLNGKLPYLSHGGEPLQMILTLPELEGGCRGGRSRSADRGWWGSCRPHRCIHRLTLFLPQSVTFLAVCCFCYRILPPRLKATKAPHWFSGREHASTKTTIRRAEKARERLSEGRREQSRRGEGAEGSGMAYEYWTKRRKLDMKGEERESQLMQRWWRGREQRKIMRRTRDAHNRERRKAKRKNN